VKVPFTTLPGDQATFIFDGPDGKKYELRGRLTLSEVEGTILPSGSVHFEWKHTPVWELRRADDPAATPTPSIPTGTATLN
jgi:hypothetical protein